MMNRFVRLFGAAAFAFLAAGCSTWRCRGFLDVNLMPKDRPRQSYVLDGIDGRGLEFRHLSTNNVGQRALSPQLAWLSDQDALVGTTYLEDIALETGLTNALPNATKIRIGIVPMTENRLGRGTLAWPMCCTFGVFPAHLVDEISFDVIVQFISESPRHVYTTAQVGQIRTDYQCGLSRLDMDNPPNATSAMAEIRDDGTIGTGRGLRPQRLREVFVKTVSAAVLRAIAERERAVCDIVPQPATEFGAVSFPTPVQEEREMTPGWGAAPDYVKPKPKTLEEFLKEAWEQPTEEETRKLKRLVELGMITRDEWNRRISEYWNRKQR